MSIVSDKVVLVLREKLARVISSCLARISTKCYLGHDKNVLLAKKKKKGTAEGNEILETIFKCNNEMLIHSDILIGKTPTFNVTVLSETLMKTVSKMLCRNLYSNIHV